jgi:hypothetical protein
MRRLVWISVAVAVSALVMGCNPLPDHGDAWLSYKYSFSCGSYSDCSVIANTDPAFSYYLGLGVADPNNYTLDMWLNENGFPGFGAVDAHAIFANLADLQFGRKMNCLQSGQKIACYVINYGQPPVVKDANHGGILVPNGSWPDITGALNDAINDNTPFGTVAMVYDPNISGPNKVAFYAFGT